MHRIKLIATLLVMLVLNVFEPVAGEQTISLPPHHFTIPDGYQLKKVAGPPLVKRPIHMCYDQTGALYVTDSSGNTDKAPKQLNDPQHRILRLVDRDGDGVFDQSTVFAENLSFPEGILVHEGAVYVGAPPCIWKFRDTDGDHVADERTIWFDGGSIEGCGNDLHGPYLGPDGFFYWCKGAFAPQKHQLSGGRLVQSNAAHIYRARPDGSQLEMVITGGMNNPVGLAFSQTGERFLSGTFFDLSKPGRRDGILHAVYGGTYGRKNPRVLKPHPATGDLLPILTQLGPAAPSGMIMAKTDSLGLQGDLLCTQFNMRRLSRHVLTPAQSTVAAQTSTLLESDQTDFHPTDVIEDVDGSLLIADTGSWYMICCPTSKIAKPDVLGAIYRLEKQGGTPPHDPRGLNLAWTVPQVSWLSDPRPAVAKRAMDALAKPENIAALSHGQASVPGVWTLHRIDDPRARDAVRSCLTSADKDIVSAAIHSIALWRDSQATEDLITLLGNHDPHLGRLAAMALGRLQDRTAVQPLLDCYSDSMDAFFKHAIIYALFEIADETVLASDHALAKQVRAMQRVAQENAPQVEYPEILPAEPVPVSPDEIARQQAHLNQLATFLPKADAGRGVKLFANQERSKCLLCHTRGNQGAKLGPDLTMIGAIRSERDLLEAIAYPSASIARYHETINVLTEDGNVVSGLLVKETAKQMFLATSETQVQAVSYQQIEQARYSNVSMMPQGLDKMLTSQEIADLVAYLRQPLSQRETIQQTIHEMPPHRAITLPGLHAYAQKSIAAGDEIEFRVSSTVPYKLRVVRLGADPENRDQDPILASFPTPEPTSQPIQPGSYIHADKGLAADRELSQLTIECWIRPFSLAGWQGLITQHDYPEHSGIGLFLNGDRIAFITDQGGQFNRAALHESDSGWLKTQQWHHVVGTWDGKMKRIFIDGELAGEFPYQGTVRPGQTALRIGAYGSHGVSDNFYNGDVAMVSLSDKAFSTANVKQRHADRGLTVPKGNAVLACWPLREERGSFVAEVGGNARHGTIINNGTWMIGGPSFDAASVDRHDSDYEPTADSDRGHALRLASDELYDARWSVSHSFEVPADAQSGLYAGRFDFKIDGQAKTVYTTFIVRRPKDRPKAPILVLVSSNTWLAYNSAPFAHAHGPQLTQMGTGGLTNSHPGAPAYSCYRDHQHGQPTYKLGMKIPWPSAGPNKTYINNQYSHLMRGERFLHLWLDKQGYAYDVVTDRDLDRDPDLLKGYEAVVINGHSEYWSARAYNGLDNYLKAGGDAVVLSGNTMFWRVTYDKDDAYMECRKFGTGIGGRRHAQVGELYHSHDFERGSLMRFCGYPAWKVVGLTCIGWGGTFKPYQVQQPDHFLFNEPHKVGLKKGDPLGIIRKGVGAVGHEYDVRLSTLQRATADSVVKGLVEPKGIVTVASSHDQRRVIDYNAEGHKPRIGNESTIAEIIYWERPQGGRVFHTGSIATAWGVYHDPAMSKLLQNVLHRFDVRPEQADSLPNMHGKPTGPL